jgi:transposase InsO family protein
MRQKLATSQRRTCRVIGLARRGPSAAATAKKAPTALSQGQLDHPAAPDPSQSRLGHRLFIMRGVPAFIRSDNGPEFVAKAIQAWINAVRTKTADIVPGSPRENGYCESINARFRDRSLIGEIFYTLKQSYIIIEEWRKHHNTKESHQRIW